MTLNSDSNPHDGQVAKEESKPLTIAEELRKAFKAADDKPVDDSTPDKQSDNKQKESDEKSASDDKAEDDTVVKEESVDETPEKLAEKEFPLIPNNWSKEEKATFKELLESEDESVRAAAEIFIERHNSMKKTFYKKTEEVANIKKELQPIKDLFAPFEQAMAANNVDKASYMKNMIMWETALQRDPVSTVKQIMQHFNVKPEQIAGRKREDDFELYDDTLTDAPKNDKVDALEKELKLLRTQIANQPVQAQLRQFEEATDASGKLLHPHYAEVKPIMGQLIQAGKAATLDEAYAKAIKTLDLPDDSSDEPENAFDLDKVRQRLVKAKKASKGISTKGGKTDFTSMSIKDELRARFKS